MVALTSTGASAAIVCNDEGDCWHAKKNHDYRPEHHVHVYPDDWKWADADHEISVAGTRRSRLLARRRMDWVLGSRTTIPVWR